MIKNLIILLLALFTSLQAKTQSIPEFDYGDLDTITVFYNLNQKLKIKFNGTEPNLTKIRFSAPRGVNISQSDSSIFIFVNAPLDAVRLKLYYKNLPVDIIDARIEKMPASNLVLSIAEEGAISKQRLAEIKALQASIPIAYTQDLHLEIYSYNLKLVQPGKNPETIPCFNNKLSDQAIKRIISLPENSIIFIDNVRLKTPQNNVIELEGPGQTYQIKS